jgi:hypothetical protein
VVDRLGGAVQLLSLGHLERMYSMDDLLELVKSENAQHLRIRVGSPPVLFLEGQEQTTEGPPITSVNAEELLQSIANSRQRRDFRENGKVLFVHRFWDGTDFLVRAKMENENVGIDIRFAVERLGGAAHLLTLGHFTPKSAPGPNKQKRDCSLPPDCKDLIDAIRLRPRKVSISLPPITRRVTLPEIVSVRYLSKLLGFDISNWRGRSAPRSIPFDQARRILRSYGIEAEQAA